MNEKIKRLTCTGMLIALAYVLMVFCRIPLVQWLKYDPKDIVIVMGGFVFGPWTAVAVSVAVSLLEMLLVSETGLIGFLMNVISTLSFCLPAALCYRYRRSLKGALTGLVLGSVLTVVAMLLWNWLVTPFYMNVPREVVAGMLLPVFLPFNATKCALNAALTVLAYRPAVKALRLAGLVPPSSSGEKKKNTWGLYVGACVVIALAIGLTFLF